ncbi:tandem-95 repeat protein, partial [Mycolicibacterium sp. BiH015]|uniref:tandem-95 repeat protein n=1 Tax=Mycolicibacterium sp. BiH015 TaxID=3018808 RepID=UPI0022E0C1DD
MSASSTETLEDLLGRTGTTVTGPLVLSSDKLTVAVNEAGAVIVGGQSGTGLIFDDVEFVKWGVPVWNFTVAYDGQNYYAKEGSNGAFSSITREDISSGTFHGYKMTATVGTDLVMDRVIGFYDGDEHAVIATRVTNIGTSTLTNVATLENTDPDQGIPLVGSFNTYNDVVLDGNFVRSHVVTEQYPNGLTIGFGSADPRAVASAQADGISNVDPFLIIGNTVDPNGEYDDIGINLATMHGNLAVGQSSVSGLIVALGTTTAAADQTYLDAAAITLTGTTIEGNAVVAVDDAYAGTEDIAVTGNLLSNDAADNPDGVVEPLTVITTGYFNTTGGGNVFIDSDGDFTYTPAANYHGVDSFTYVVSDTTSYDIGQVTITVAAVEDDVVANGSYFYTYEDFAANGPNLLDIDRTYNPDGAEEPLTITAGTFATAAGGSVTIGATGSVAYTPKANFFGDDSFTYTLSDGTSTDVGTVSIYVYSENDVPVAVNDSKTMAEDTPRTFTTTDLLWNDSDPDKAGGDILSFHSVSGAVNGVVVLNADGTVTFTPAANYNGPASFTYKVKDTAGAVSANSATVSLTITAVNDA